MHHPSGSWPLLAAIATVAACTHAPPPNDPAAEARLARIEQRLNAIEKAHRTVGAESKLPIAERVARLESNLAGREEALAFLDAVYAQTKQQAQARDADEPDPDAVFAVDISGAIAGGQVEGPLSAPVTIIKAFDFACPYCRRLNEPLHELVKEYAGKVRVVYMNFIVHPDATDAHHYSCAAAKQGKYLAWKDAWWKNGFDPYAASAGKDKTSLGKDNILAFSKQLGLDVRRLEADANSEACKKRIDADIQELSRFHVTGTPALFINGKVIVGALPKADLAAIIDQRLTEVKASKVPPAKYYAQEIMGKGVHEFRSKQDAQGGS